MEKLVPCISKSHPDLDFELSDIRVNLEIIQDKINEIIDHHNRSSGKFENHRGGIMEYAKEIEEEQRMLRELIEKRKSQCNWCGQSFWLSRLSSYEEAGEVWFRHLCPGCYYCIKNGIPRRVKYK